MDPVRWTRGLACALVLSGCVRHLPPAAPPAQVVPPVRLPAQPPVQGIGRVIIDVADGPAAVEQETGRAIAAGHEARAYRLLCQTTPCFADLAFGTYQLRLTLRSDETQVGFSTVTVSDVPMVVRTDVGEIRSGGAVNVFGRVLVLLGVLGAITGGTATIIESTRDWGLPLLLGSGAGLLVGIVLMVVDPATIQEDATTTFELPRAPAPAEIPITGPAPQLL